VSVPRFFADHHVDMALVEQARLSGIDIETARDAGLEDDDDMLDILPHLLGTERLLITQDQRFRANLEDLTRRGHSHPGVLFVRRQHENDIGGCLATLLLIAGASEAEEWRDQVMFIPLD